MKMRLFAIALCVFVFSLGIALTITAQGPTQHWAQVNPSGFGVPGNGMISALSPFNGQLYAGTGNDNGAQIWRRSGASWSPVITNGLGITRNAGIDHLYPFNGQLYAGTYNEVDGGEVWRSSTGLSWTRVVTQGFGDPTNGEVMRFAVFSNTLYASTWSYTTTHGAEVWRSNTGNAGDWSRVVANGFNGDANNGTVLSFEVLNGYIYAGTLNGTTGGEVWRSPTGNTGSWTQVNVDGFGDTGNVGISALSAFGGYLYAATHHSMPGGAQVWRCQTCDGSDWTKVVDNGFGRLGARRMPALEVLDNYLYLAIGNSFTGLEVWRTANGTDWDQIGFDGFGDANNQVTYFDNAVSILNGGLYIGTSNYATGGQIWVYKPLIATRYVAPGGNCGGATPCYATIQSAVDAASDLDVIKVAAGAYTDVHVRSRNDVTTTGVVTQVVYISITLMIEGGYTTTNWITPNLAANLTTLDAQGQGRVIYITGGINPVIEGLRITGGDARGMGGEGTALTVDSGGGVYVWRSLATLRNNWVFSNTAATGGGAYVMGPGWGFPDDPGATIEGNTIFSNTADGGGGLALTGGAADVIDNIIRQNRAALDGGGLYLLLSSPTLQRNIISANRAANSGGGIGFQWGSPTLINNVIADNHLDNANWGKGSGLSIGGADSHLSHNTIARNTGGDGSGVYIFDWFEWAQPTVFMTNTIVVNQSVGVNASGVSTVTINGILWHNTPITVSKSVTAVVTVNNQFAGNPVFAADGYHLTAGSAAIDNGIDAGVTVDIDGESRPAGAGYDLGADELWYRVYLPLIVKNH